MSENNARYWEGKTLSEGHKKKISESQKGEKNHMYGKCGEKSPVWKDYPRIIKNGKNRHGNQQYGIIYNGKVFATSVDKEKLYGKWYSKYPDTELIDETI